MPAASQPIYFPLGRLIRWQPPCRRIGQLRIQPQRPTTEAITFFRIRNGRKAATTLTSGSIIKSATRTILSDDSVTKASRVLFLLLSTIYWTVVGSSTVLRKILTAAWH